nr:hypothetical protein [uncultured bacterium]
MKPAEFKQDYEIDRTAKGIRANARNGGATPGPVILTGDSEPFDASREYFFFDERMREVRTSTGLRRYGDHLGSSGLKRVAIDNLRVNRDDALTDAQDALISEMAALQEKVAAFEQEKRPENRSLRRIVQARNFGL